MKNLNIRPIYVIGDIHGNFKIDGKLSHLENADIIFLGDIGVGLGAEKYLKYFDAFLGIHKLTAYFLRGNHDNPKCWKEHNEYENIVFLEDYEVFELSGITFLPIGGAISIDRKDRKEGFSYFLDEHVVYNIDSVKDVDVVLSHTSPSIFYPVVHSTFFLERVKVDPSLMEEVSIERKFLTDVFQKIKGLKAWYYGHFHSSNSEIIDGVKVSLLNVNEIKEVMI